MDAEIYKLIANAEEEQSKITTKKHVNKSIKSNNFLNADVDLLKQAFAILDPESNPKKEKANTDTENISQNLYVQCAEAAIAVKNI